MLGRRLRLRDLPPKCLTWLVCCGRRCPQQDKHAAAQRGVINPPSLSCSPGGHAREACRVGLRVRLPRCRVHDDDGLFAAHEAVGEDLAEGRHAGRAFRGGEDPLRARQLNSGVEHLLIAHGRRASAAGTHDL